MDGDEYRKNIHTIMKFSRVEPALDEYPDKQKQMDKEMVPNKNSGGYQDPMIKTESPTFDWFPPILLYKIFEGDLCSAESCLVWINQVYAILRLMNIQ